MKKLAVLSTVALIGIGSVATAPDAEARPWRGHRGGAVAAGVIGGLAAGALIGAAASSAYAAPAYGYDYGYAPAYGYGYGYAPVAYEYAPAPVYRTRVVRRSYAPVAYGYDYAPVYRTRRVVRTSYRYAPVSYSYGYSWGGPAYYGW